MSAGAALLEHTIEDVARILGMPVSAVRELLDEGEVLPSQPLAEARFGFGDLVVLRAVKRLREAKVPLWRIRSALRGVERSLKHGGSLAAVRITARGKAIVADDGETVWNPESGQVLFDFADDAAGLRGPEVTRWEKKDELTAEGWFELACELEADDGEGGLEAYRRALDLDPGHFDANLNLGRCLHERGELEEAVRCYRRAMESRPGAALAAFNLGVAMEDLGRAPEAIAAYGLALEADPECADAHFNIARLHEAAGETASAVRHLMAYRRLTQREP